jgi:hypothetical protein
MNTKTTTNRFLAKLIRTKTPSHKLAFGLLTQAWGVKIIWISDKVRKMRNGKTFYIDLYCPELQFGIEIDGGIHNDRQNYDMERDLMLMNEKHDSVIRFRNEEISNREFFINTVQEGIINRLLYALERYEKGFTGWNENVNKFLLRWGYAFDVPMRDKVEQFTKIFPEYRHQRDLSVAMRPKTV